MTTRLAAMYVPDLLHCRAIGAKFVSDDNLRFAIPLHRFSEEFQGCSLVPLLRDIGLEHFALMIDCAPEVVRLASNFHEHLIQMPAPLRDLTHRFRSPFADLVGEVWSKSIDPEADTFVADIDATFMEEVFDITQ